jgi:hypothetical protein
MRQYLVRIVALLGLLFAGIVQAAHFDAQYAIRSGDANGDQRADIYLHYRPQIVPIALDDLTIPIPLRSREIGDFVLLQQANGTFVSAPVTSAQRSTYSAWPIAPLKLLLSDFDADSNVDLLLRKVASIAPGAQDIIVYAPTAVGAPPTEVRQVDEGIVKFIRDLQGWGENHQSYYANAYYTTVVAEYPVVVNFYDCTRSGGSAFVQFEADSPGDWGAQARCDLLFFIIENRPIYGEVFNTYDYSQAAKIVADTLAPFSDETTPVSDAAMHAVIAQISTTIGRPYYPDAIPGSIDWEELRKILKVIAKGGAAAAARVSVIVGGILFPSETADSDRSDEWADQGVVNAAGTQDASGRNDGYLYFYHATLTKYIPSILAGIATPSKRNFPDDTPGFYLATNRSWAFTFGRSWFTKHKSWATIEFRMTTSAHGTLLGGGAYYRFHPPSAGLRIEQTTFELIIPPHLYSTFNSLMASGQIVATPIPIFRY